MTDIADKTEVIDWAELKVLVIEDEPYIRQIIRGLLRTLGVKRIDEAGDGKAGYGEVIRTRPDVVLCDINMSPVNGLAFLRTLRKSSVASVARTPVIFLTAEKGEEAVIQAVELKVNGYLTKPVSPNDLKNRLIAVLRSEG